jgi:hypothetical protein
MHGLRGLVQVIKSHPALVVHNLAVFEEVERLLAEAIADRVGVDAVLHPYPRLLAGVAVLALKTALDRWFADPGLDLPKLAGEAIDYVRAGLPQPGGDCPQT